MAENQLDNNTLGNWLWEAACKIRGDVDAPKYNLSFPSYSTNGSRTCLRTSLLSWKKNSAIGKLFKVMLNTYLKRNGG